MLGLAGRALRRVPSALHASWPSGGPFVAGGLGWFGFAVFEGSRVTLLVAGAALSLVALALYFHPFYLVAVAINIGIIFLLWGDFLASRGPA